MTDVFTPAERSRIMARIHGKHTKPEILVRSLLHRLGYRFRLHVKTLPGSPDIVLPRHKKAILVHGCFWHGHAGCNRAKMPATRTEYWAAKIAGNRARDEAARKALEEMGYGVLVIWTCRLKPLDRLIRDLQDFMGPTES